MKKNKLIVLGLAALMSLTSCGGLPPTEVDQYLPADDPTNEVVVHFWHCIGAAKEKNLLKIVNTFNEEYKGKYRVELSRLAGGYDELHDTVKTRLASGEVPALAMGYPDSFSEYISNNMDESFLLRINNFIEDETFGYTEAEIADFVPGYYNEGTNYQFEGTWSMPMYKSTEVVYYNYSYFMGLNDMNYKKFATNDEFNALKANTINRTFDDDDGTLEDDLQELKAWVDAHDGYTYEMVETWDEAIVLSRQMKADRLAEGITSEFYPFGYDSDANLMISQMAQRDIPYTVNNEESQADPRKHFVFNNDEAKALVEEIIGYLDEGIMITKNSIGGQYTNEYFTSNKCAFTVGSTGGSSYNVSSNFAVKLAPVPYKGERKYIQQGPSICFFACGDEYVQKGAWLFYKTLADASNNALLALENSYDPIRISSYETDEYEQFFNDQIGMPVMIPQMTATLKEYYMTSPVFVGSSTARDQIGQIINYVYGSNYSIDQAFQMAYDNCVSNAI